MTGPAERLRENLGLVHGRIAAACERSGRDPAGVRIVAVTKYAEWPWVEALTGLGVTTLGESRPQQLIERSALMRCPVEWHLIGHLQRNKVRGVLPITELIHSVDSQRLLERIEQVADELALRPPVLLQVNVSGEASKDGLSPEELRRVVRGCDALSRVRITGLMTMAPFSDDPESARPVFRGLRELRDELRTIAPPNVMLDQLSMGMSNDFDVAVEEGATLVRLGSVLFEGIHGESPSQ